MLLKLETQSVSCNESWIFGASSDTSKVSSQRKGLVTSNSLVWYFSTGLIGFLTKGHGRNRNGWCCVSFNWKIPYFTYRVINCCFIFTHKSFCHFKRFILRSLNISSELTSTQENIGPWLAWLTGFLHHFLFVPGYCESSARFCKICTSGAGIAREGRRGSAYCRSSKLCKVSVVEKNPARLNSLRKCQQDYYHFVSLQHVSSWYLITTSEWILIWKWCKTFQ